MENVLQRFSCISFLFKTFWFIWVISCKASQNYKVRRNLEASYIALIKPTLNEQTDFEILILFRNGITWIPASISC